MSAPILRVATREPIAAADLPEYAEIYGRGDIYLTRLLSDGKLWQREVERDVQAHGQPMPPTNLEKIRRLREQAHPLTPWPARVVLDALMLHRRTAMRARRAGGGGAE